jgi:hypothetical protein
MSSTLSRRSALRAGGLAAIAAGVLGTTITTASAAPAPSMVTMEQILAASSTSTRERLSAECLAAREGYDDVAWATPDIVNEDDTRLQAGVSPEMYELHARMMRDVERKLGLYAEWQLTELRRHLPLLAPVIAAVWEHVSEMDLDDAGVCCLG